MSLDSIPTLNTRPSHSPSTSTSSLAGASSLDGASAAVLTGATTDAWLWRVLQNEKNREMISRLEDTLDSFVRDDQISLAFPPRNPFHRKVCYAVARRYGLDHRLEASEPPFPLSSPANPSPPSSDNMRLVLLKTPHSASPLSRLATFADGPPPPAALNPPTLHTVASTSRLPSETHVDSNRPAPSASASSDGESSCLRPATFLRRPRPADGKTHRPPIASNTQNKSSGSATAIKRMTEEDYEKARARIFSASNGLSKAINNGPSDGKSKIDSWTLSEDGNSNRIAVMTHNVAKGPIEGSRGFEQRRSRRGGGNTSATHLNSAPLNGGSVVEGKHSIRKSGYNDSNLRSATRSSRDPSRNNIGNGSETAIATSVSNCASSGGSRRYANDSTFGDLQDPDFDRSYMKWARRGPVTSTPSVQAPTAGLPIYAAPLMYPYVTQALSQHPIHSAPISVHSSIALPPSAPLVTPHGQIGVTTGLSTNLAGMHHRGVLAGAAGISLSMGPGLDTNIPRQDAVDVGGNGHLFSRLDQRYRENGSVMFASPNPGISCGVTGSHTVAPLPLPHSSIQDITVLPNTNGLSKVGMPIDLPQPQRTVNAMMNWPSQSMPTVVRSPPPAYGLDSTVDFPPLR